MLEKLRSALDADHLAAVPVVRLMHDAGSAVQFMIMGPLDAGLVPGRRTGQLSLGFVQRRQRRLDLLAQVIDCSVSDSFSPRCSSGSSTVKPGPRVAISDSTPDGSRK